MAGARPVYILNRGGGIQFDLFKNKISPVISIGFKNKTARSEIAPNSVCLLYRHFPKVPCNYHISFVM